MKQLLPACAAILLSGCAHHCTERVEILHLDTFRAASFQGKSRCWDALVQPTSVHAREVSQLCPTPKGLLLMTRDLEGKVLWEKLLPYYDTYFSTTPFALRPDGKAAAYFPSDTTAVHVFDFATDRQTRITDELTRDHPHIEGLAWLDNRYLLAVLSDQLDEARDAKGERKIKTTVPSSVVKIDSVAGKVVGGLELRGAMGNALSPSGKFIAVQQFKRGAPIAIVDTASLSVVAQTAPATHNSSSHEPAWSPDESRLAYVEYFPDSKEHWLKVLALKTGATENIARLGGNDVCYFVGFPREDLLAYLIGDGDHAWSDLHLVKFPSGEPLKVIRSDYNGKSAVVADGEAIVFQKGY